MHFAPKPSARTLAKPPQDSTVAGAMREDGVTERTVADRLDPDRAAALWAALDLSGDPPGSGEPLPPFFHQIYFNRLRPPRDLGLDGHPSPGLDVPDLGLPRRMWAGGRLTFHAPLLCGIRAEKTSRVIATTQKSGRTGPLAFVTIRHEIRQRNGLAVTEDQDLVYRPADAPVADPVAAPTAAQHRDGVRFDPVLLFRYSALTLNGHRIHYDADYARGAEGYPGLVVHGPLLAQSLMLMAETHRGPLSGFAFRGASPLCLPETATLSMTDSTLWVTGEDGRLIMSAEAS